MVIEVCKHVPVKNPDDLLSLFLYNHATLGQFFSAIYNKAKQVKMNVEHLDGTDKKVVVLDIFVHHVHGR